MKPTHEEFNQATKLNEVDLPSIAKQKIERDGNRWRVVVELTWDVLPEDITPKWEGDAAVDFANRAFARIRGTLNSIIGKGKPFAHWHVLERTRRCREFD